MDSHSPQYFIGVDVGTSSARAAITDAAGTILASATCAIQIHSPAADLFEQSSADIWRQCCSAVKQALADSAIDPQHVVSIGFDATCSLVALDDTFAPVSVSPTAQPDSNTEGCTWDIVMWMDHRAVAETARINATGHPVLQLTGGALSVEMQVPKLLWLQTHMPDAFQRTRHWFDLPDFLTWRASGKLDRSMCSLVCKWTYVPEQSASCLGFKQTFFDQIGLKIPSINDRLLGGGRVRQIGEAVGTLTAAAARELGLHTKVVVGVSMIDAHAGAVATLAHPGGPVTDNLALISGTSACHIALNQHPKLVKGVWGPYEGVVLPGSYAMEAGQSACGKLLDHIVETHPAYSLALSNAQATTQHIYQYLNAHLARLAENNKVPSIDHLAASVHVYPDFHGNRSPISDPTFRGTIHGLTLDTSVDSLAILYLATVHALALQTRDIVETAREQGQYALQRVCLSGGLVHNAVFVRVLADALRVPVVLPRYPEASVVLGAAVVGAAAAASASGAGGVWEAMSRMTRPGREVLPSEDDKVQRLFEAKYQAYELMKQMQVGVRELMKSV
ncbi:putative carbohydrate kinase [Catenaria anguillulae PL171]|uniref:Putative carbohydrate kinase n=1 Tax=Catenaria anguillulae PL171 TaxID=765915 RepID=A0A1Y2I4C3_9FUNG|nr:putative carbohydrate kinase [Catenaria anguillulae PL171]